MVGVGALITIVIIIYLLQTVRKTYVTNKENPNPTDVEVLYLNGKRKIKLPMFLYMLSEFKQHIHQCTYFISDNYNQNPVQDQSPNEMIYSLLVQTKKNILVWSYNQHNTSLTKYMEKISLHEEDDINLEKQVIAGSLISISKLSATSKHEYRDSKHVDEIKIKQLINVVVGCLNCICTVLDNTNMIQNSVPIDITPMEKFLLLFKKHVDVDTVIVKQNTVTQPKLSSIHKLIYMEECDGSWKQDSNVNLRGKKPKSLNCKSKRIAFSTVIH